MLNKPLPSKLFKNGNLFKMNFILHSAAIMHTPNPLYEEDCIHHKDRGEDEKKFERRDGFNNNEDKR